MNSENISEIVVIHYGIRRCDHNYLPILVRAFLAAAVSDRFFAAARLAISATLRRAAAVIFVIRPAEALRPAAERSLELTPAQRRRPISEAVISEAMPRVYHTRRAYARASKK